MIYADTDFFLALLKPTDWLQESARRLLERHRGELWTSFAVLTELLLLAKRFSLDAERLVAAAMELVEVRGCDSGLFLVAANYIKNDDVSVFDTIHAAAAGTRGKILSSDRVFDRLGLERVDLRSG